MRHPIKSLVQSAIRFVRSEHGSSDLTVGLLLTAAGAAMVGLTVPTMFKSSDTASRTFDRQVQILERGAGGAPVSGAAAAPGAGFEVGPAPAIPAMPAGTALPAPRPADPLTKVQ